jgi:hypothetical protein
MHHRDARGEYRANTREQAADQGLAFENTAVHAHQVPTITW